MGYRKSVSDETLRSFDPIVHALTIIQEEHRLVHDGHGFILSHVHEGLAKGASAYTLHRTGALPAHLRACDLTVERGPAQIDWFEGVIVAHPGAILPALNANRMTATGPVLQSYYSPTVVNFGQLIITQYIGSMGGSNSSPIAASSSSFGEEIILKPNTDYLFRLTNNSTKAITWSCQKFWYEVPEEYSK